MILLSVHEITKHFGPEPVLAGVTFDLRPGERASLVGPNGAGKTTLMRIIAAAEQADSGRVELHSSARLGYLEQHPEFEPGHTVWDEAHSALAAIADLALTSEELASAIATETEPDERKRLEHRFEHIQYELHHHDAYNLDYRIERILEGLGFAKSSFQHEVGKLSGGQQNRLLLAKLLLAEPDLMLLDEPSNHLDIDATEWLENFLIESEQAMLVVSHDRYFLDRTTNRTLELYQGTVESYPGNFTQYKRLKAERLEVQKRTYERQQEEIAKMEDFIRRYHFGERHQQAEDRRKKLERIERVPAPREIAAPPMGFPPASRTGDIVLRAEHLTKGFPGKPLFDDLSLDILRGEKWGILGPNGCGKTTLLRCLLGQLALDEGRVILGTGVKIGYFDQMLSGLDPQEQALDAVRPSHKEFLEQQRRDLLARFGVTGDMVFQKIGSLSGGEQNRTALARLAASDANFLILDEPTNHLDLWARGSLEKALREFDGSVIFVSHDRYFLNQVATKLLIVEPGRFRVIDGNYDTYLHFVKQGLVREARAAVAAHENSLAGAKPGQRAPRDDSASTKSTKERRKRKYPYRKVPEIEADIAQREARIEALHQLFASEEVLRDGSRIKQLKAELEEHESALPRLYEHWEEASEMN
ncbi:MAG: ABC-F family ATP-binding cassette domain-containing protein [Planctomycetaceae bacterium]|nr:ABC-F family ATP-binding cassette domain-containing protein [Planctomycetaceae bacterium]